MKGVIIDPKSPYYWIRYYDSVEVEPKKRRKKLKTGILVTKADWGRYKHARKNGDKKAVINGTSELKTDLAAFRRGLARAKIERKSQIKLEFDKPLSEGYAEFKISHSVPASRDFLKEKTLINYTIAVDHMIKACKDKYIYKYDEDDYNKLLRYFETVKVPGKIIIHSDGREEKKYKKMSQNSRAIYTRTLRSLWKYFCEKNYASKIIIKSLESEDKDPSPIPLSEMFSILSCLKQDEKNSHHFQLVYFLLLTGCRPSSAMVQLKEDINYKSKYITIQNVKTGRRKNKLSYKFPLFAELEKLLKSIISNEQQGRLFYQFKLNELNYTYPLSFWERTIKILNTANKISDYYSLKQIRSTTASFFANTKKINPLFVQRLLDHSDQKVTERHYIERNLKVLRDELDDITLDDFVPE